MKYDWDVCGMVTVLPIDDDSRFEVSVSEDSAAASLGAAWSLDGYRQLYWGARMVTGLQKPVRQHQPIHDVLCASKDDAIAVVEKLVDDVKAFKARLRGRDRWEVAPSVSIGDGSCIVLLRRLGVEADTGQQLQVLRVGDTYPNGMYYCVQWQSWTGEPIKITSDRYCSSWGEDLLDEAMDWVNVVAAIQPKEDGP